MLQHDPRSVSESTKSIHLTLLRGIVTEESRDAQQQEQEPKTTRKCPDEVVD